MNYHNQWVCEFGSVNPYEIIQHLNNQSTLHAVSKQEIFKSIRQQTSSFDQQTLNNEVFKQEISISSRYSDAEFQGIMPNTGAAGVSTAGEPQVKAIQKLDNTIQIDRSRAGESQIRFGKGEASSIGTINFDTPLGIITFHVIPLNTPFLLCIQDMKRMGVILDNLQNVLIQGTKIVPIVMKFGHPWMLLYNMEQSIAYCHLTESELR